MAERTLFLTFDNIEVTVTTRHTVGMRMRAPTEETGLAPGLVPAVELSPTEARHLAQTLLDKADAAEGEQLQH
jgi:hypothetical protein